MFAFEQAKRGDCSSHLKRLECWASGMGADPNWGRDDEMAGREQRKDAERKDGKEDVTADSGLRMRSDEELSVAAAGLVAC